MKKIYFIFLLYLLPLLKVIAQISPIYEQVIPLTNNNADLTSSAILNDVVYFLGYDEVTGRELWRSDGTKAGTKLFKDIFTGNKSSNPSNFGNFGKKLFFYAFTTSNLEIFSLFTSNGSIEGTFQIKDFTNPEDLIVFDDKIFCQAKTNGSYYIYSINGNNENAEVVSGKLEQFYTDDSYFADKILNYKLFEQNGKLFLKQNTQLLVYDKTTGKFITYLKYFEVNNLTNPSISIPAKDFVYLGYQISSTQFELFSFKLVDKKLSKLAVYNFNENYFKNFNPIIYENTIFFSANNNTNGFEPWVSNGTLEGTKMVSDIDVGTGSSYRNQSSFLIGDKILFQASEKQNIKSYIFTYDITNKTLEKLKDQIGRPLGNFFGNIYINKSIAVIDKKVIFGAYAYTKDPEKNDPNYFNVDYINKNYEYGTFIYSGQSNKLELLEKSDAANTLPLISLLGSNSHIIKDNKIYDIGESYKDNPSFSTFRPGAIIPSFDINSKETRSEFFLPSQGSTSNTEKLIPNANFDGSLVVTGAAFFKNNALVTLKDIPGLLMIKKCDSQVKINANVFETCKDNSMTFTTTNNSPTWYFRGFPISNEKILNKKFDESGWLHLEGVDNIGCRTIEKKFITIIKEEINADIIGNTGFCEKEILTLKTTTNSPDNIKGYQWYLDSQPIVNENKDSIVVKKSGLYSVTINGKNGCSIVKATLVKLAITPNINITRSGSTDILTGNSVVLTVPSASDQTYQWIKDEDIIPNATNNSYKAIDGGNYSVMVTKSGCVAISEKVQVNLILANETPYQSLDFKTYPNPFENSVKISFSEPIKKTAKLNLINANGLIIKEWIVNQQENTLNLIDISSGIYLLQAEFNGRKSTQKLIKNN